MGQFEGGNEWRRSSVLSHGMQKEFDPPLDAGIKDAVEALWANGVETFESCEGGQGHALLQPTVRFHGQYSEGLRALSIAIRAGLPVASLRRVWEIEDNEPCGPWWELTFTPTKGH